MSDNASVQDLINAIDSGSSTDIDNAFNATMADKISTNIDALRQDYAQNMFKSSQEITDELSVEEPNETEIQNNIEPEENVEVEVQDTADTPIEKPTEEN